MSQVVLSMGFQYPQMKAQEQSEVRNPDGSLLQNVFLSSNTSKSSNISTNFNYKHTLIQKAER